MKKSCLWYFVILNKRSRNTEGVVENGQFRETGNIAYTRHKTKQKHNMCWTPLYVNKHTQCK